MLVQNALVEDEGGLCFSLVALLLSEPCRTLVVFALPSTVAGCCDLGIHTACPGFNSGLTVALCLLLKFSVCFQLFIFFLNISLFGHRGVSCDFACGNGDLNLRPISISAGEGPCSSGVTL